MKRMKRALALFSAIALILSLSAMQASAAATPKLAIDGAAISIPAAYGTPFIDSANRLQVPIRIVSEKLGATVSWNQSTQTATVDGTIKIKVGSYSMSTPYGPVPMDTAAVNKDGRVYIPIRYLTDAMGYDVTTSTENGALTANIVTKVELTISAAASLKNAMTEIQELYLAEKPNTKLTYNFASSGALQQQIEQGAAVDIFFSAATKNMDTLKSAGLLKNSSIVNLLGNDVVLIVPKDSALTLSSFTDVTGDSVKSIGLGEPKSVPAGQYAADVFTYYKILDKVTAKAVYGTPVTQILTWVETGNVDCGVVYSTDAAASMKVRVVATAPDETHTPIVYPAAVLKATTHSAAANDFLNFLSSSAAKAVFVQYGFSIV